MSRSSRAPTSLASRLPRRDFLRLVAAGSAGLAVAACGSALPDTVEIRDETGFQPGSISVPKGARVVWINRGALPHSVGDNPLSSLRRPDTLPRGAQPWDSGLINSGSSYARRFSIPGRYVYTSFREDGRAFIGTITVTA